MLRGKRIALRGFHPFMVLYMWVTLQTACVSGAPVEIHSSSTERYSVTPWLLIFSSVLGATFFITVGIFIGTCLSRKCTRNRTASRARAPGHVELGPLLMSAPPLLRTAPASPPEMMDQLERGDNESVVDDSRRWTEGQEPIEGQLTIMTSNELLETGLPSEAVPGGAVQPARGSPTCFEKQVPCGSAVDAACASGVRRDGLEKEDQESIQASDTWSPSHSETSSSSSKSADGGGSMMSCGEPTEQKPLAKYITPMRAHRNGAGKEGAETKVTAGVTGDPDANHRDNDGHLSNTHDGEGHGCPNSFGTWIPNSGNTENRIQRPPVEDYDRQILKKFSVRLRFPVESSVSAAELQATIKLGAGSFGTVYAAEISSPTETTDAALAKLDFALKVPRRDSVDHTAIQREIQALLQLKSHLNVVGFIGYSEKLCWLLTELCEGGALDEHMVKSVKELDGTSGRLAELLLKDYDLEMREIFCGICSGMSHLHDLGFIHRDLASRNILLTRMLVPKISDFGCGIFESDVVRQPLDKLPWEIMPPETLRDCTFNKKVDVWSFGLLLYELTSFAQAPFLGIESPVVLLVELLGGKRPGRAPPQSFDVYNLVLHCMSTECIDRPSFVILKNHIREVPFIDAEFIRSIATAPLVG